MNALSKPGCIVVGVDGSDHADRAVRWAAEQAQLEHRPLVVVATEDHRAPRWTAEVPGADPMGDVPDMRPASTLAVDAGVLARRDHPTIDVELLSVLGDPRQVLIELSSSAHLVVVGSHGRGMMRSLLLGSVSEAVARSASCPVVVCRPGPDHPTDGVIVGADGSTESLPVVEFAFEQASLHGLPLTIVHCFWDAVAAVAGFREGSSELLNEPHLEELRLLLAESVAGFREKYPDVEVSLLLRHGLVDEALTRRGRAWDLVVVGRHPHASPHRLFAGSIATAVLERARGCVAVVPEAAP